MLRASPKEPTTHLHTSGIRRGLPLRCIREPVRCGRSLRIMAARSGRRRILPSGSPDTRSAVEQEFSKLFIVDPASSAAALERDDDAQSELDRLSVIDLQLAAVQAVPLPVYNPTDGERTRPNVFDEANAVSGGG